MAGVLMAGLFVASCAPPPEPPVLRTTHDLLAELPTADLATEIDGLVFGQGDARRFLRQGFSIDEFEGRLERPFVWAVGNSSEIVLPIVHPRDGTLLLEARPFRDPEAPAQTLDVYFNDEPVGRFELHPHLASYPIAVPASLQRLGDNRLRFDHGRFRDLNRPSGPPSVRRELATAFFSLRWEEPSPVVGTKPQADLAGGRLFLPQGTRLDFFLAIEPGSRLRSDPWSFRGSGSRLRVSIQEDGGDAEVFADLDAPPTSDGALALPGATRRIVRLRIESLGPGDGAPSWSPEAGVLWHRPRIEAVSPSPPPPADGPSPNTATAAEGGVLEAPAQTPPNVLIYLIDTLRADHLGSYGYPLPTSPHLDRLAAEAVLFEQATGQSSWTRASVASMLTGLWPVAHGTNRRDEVLSDDAITLPELMRQRGYRTAAFLSNPNVSEGFGFGQGFDHVVDLGDVDTDAADLHSLAMPWIDDAGDDRPFFVYIHTIDPHSPYDPPAEFRQRFAPGVPQEVAWTPSRLSPPVQRLKEEASPEEMAEMVGLYDAEIAFNDAAFGELRSFLEDRGFFDDTLLMVLSDHGEEFFEHGNLEHGKNLFVETLHIPWIVKPAGVAGMDFEPRRIADPVQHIDLLPTLDALLDLFPQGADRTFEGRDLSPLWRPSQPGSNRLGEPVIFSYLHLDGPRRVSLVEGPWKLVHRIEEDGRLVRPHLFHRLEDPRERTNLAAAKPILRRYLSKRIRQRLNGPERRLETSTTEIDEALRQRLEALGYLQ